MIDYYCNLLTVTLHPSINYKIYAHFILKLTETPSWAKKLNAQLDNKHYNLKVIFFVMITKSSQGLDWTWV